MNKKIVMLIFASFLFQCTGKNAKTKSPSSSDLSKYELASKYFMEVSDISAKDDGELWKYNLSGPMLLVDTKTREVYANVKDTVGLLQRKDEIYFGRLPDTISIANTAIDWGGNRWTMLMLPLSKDQKSRARLLMHESFHRIQPLIGFDFTKVDFYSCNHLDSKDGRIYLKLELEALKSAIEVGKINNEAMNHIKNAILFRLYRYQLYPENASSENIMEMLEGLAEYTGLKLSGRIDKEIIYHYKKDIDRFLENPTFVRSFAYHTLPGYGYLMSLENEKWNLDISINTDLIEYIMDFYSIEIPQNLNEIVKKNQLEYNFIEISKEEENRENERRKMEQYYIKTFFENSRLIIKSEKLDFSFDPRNVTPLESRNGTVYPTIWANAEWGKLEVESGGAFVNRTNDTIIVSSPIKIDGKHIKGVGWVLELNSGWRVSSENSEFSTIVRE